jgi:hypothetical protein
MEKKSVNSMNNKYNGAWHFHSEPQKCNRIPAKLKISLTA